MTAYAGGQVSLNPIPHIKREIFGMLILPLISAAVIGWPFGYASTPYDANWAYNHPRKAAWMALAGPTANLLIVVICYMVIKLGITSGLFLQPDSVNLYHIIDPVSDGGWSGITLLVSMLFTMNLILVVLNLFPFPPLDGSGVISIFLHDDAARKYRKVIANPMFGFAGLALAWFAFNPLFQMIFLRSINIIYWGSIYR